MTAPAPVQLDWRRSSLLPLAEWVCVLSPILMLAVFVALAAHVRQSLGHWPTPMTENFESGTASLLDEMFIWAGFFAVFCAIPLWAVSFWFRRHQVTRRGLVTQIAAFLLGWGLVVAFTFRNPGNFIGWFVD